MTRNMQPITYSLRFLFGFFLLLSCLFTACLPPPPQPGQGVFVSVLFPFSPSFSSARVPGNKSPIPPLPQPTNERTNEPIKPAAAYFLLSDQCVPLDTQA